MKLGVEVILIPISRGPASAQTHSPTCIIPAQQIGCITCLTALSVQDCAFPVYRQKQLMQPPELKASAAFLESLESKKRCLWHDRRILFDVDEPGKQGAETVEEPERMSGFDSDPEAC